MKKTQEQLIAYYEKQLEKVLGTYGEDGYYPCDLALWERPARSTDEFGYKISKDDDIVDCDEWQPIDPEE